MYNTELQVRFAQCCSDAMMGYMTAATAASAAAFGQMLEAWGSASRTMADASAATRAPIAERATSAALPSAFADYARYGSWGTPAVSALFPWFPGPKVAETLSPLDLWLCMTPFGRSPFVLQMAGSMMAFGIPRDVAMPAAEANAAALKAAEAAVAPVRDAFSSYRSDGGHASAQILPFQKLIGAFMIAPISLAAFGPYLSGPRPFGV